jgi:hypothetical protein
MLGLLASVLLLVHPLHTSVTEISYDAGTGTAMIRIRVFADDLGAALTSHGGLVDSVMSGYVRGAFTISDRSGRSLPIRWIGAETSGDVVLLYLAVRAPDGLAQARLRNALLSERFADQVNIVRVLRGGRAITLLFTRGEPAKALP